MRQIKFRAWGCQRRPQDEWKMFVQEDWNIEKFLINLRTECLSWKDLMQFTGLKDKNGKEIYEEDIVRWNQTGYTQSIVFKHGAFCIGIELLSSYTEANLDIEVIGNIYENPELLK